MIGNTRDVNVGKLAPTWKGLYKVTAIAGTGAYNLEDLTTSPAIECLQLKVVLSLIISIYEYEWSIISYVYNIEQYESHVCPCRCIDTFGFIIINFHTLVNKHK